MQKKVKVNVPKTKHSNKKHTPSIKGGHPLAKQHSPHAVGLKRKVIIKGKSLSSKKSHNIKRSKRGVMGKNAGQVQMYRPFMA
jgi:hypothetical protein